MDAHTSKLGLAFVLGGIQYLVPEMPGPLKFFFLLVLIAVVMDLCWRSAWTKDHRASVRVGIGFVAIMFMLGIAWEPIIRPVVGGATQTNEPNVSVPVEGKPSEAPGGVFVNDVTIEGFQTGINVQNAPGGAIGRVEITTAPSPAIPSASTQAATNSQAPLPPCEGGTGIRVDGNSTIGRLHSVIIKGGCIDVTRDSSIGEANQILITPGDAP